MRRTRGNKRKVRQTIYLDDPTCLLIAKIQQKQPQTTTNHIIQAALACGLTTLLNNIQDLRLKPKRQPKPKPLSSPTMYSGQDIDIDSIPDDPEE